MTRDEIQKEFDKFFEFPGDDRSQVTSVSCRLFAELIARLETATEREACAVICHSYATTAFDKSARNMAFECRDAIRERGGQ